MRPPYAILRRSLQDADGGAHEIAIGVIGLTPPQAASWDHAQLAGRLVLRDMVETARAWIPAIRAAGADLVIALAHTGIDTGTGPDAPMMENAARALARVPGLDALIAGHSHRRFPGPDHARTAGADISEGTLHGTPCVNPGFGAMDLGQIDLRSRAAPMAGGWRLIGSLRPARGAPPCRGMQRALARAHSHTIRLTERPLGTIRAPLHSYLALARDDPGLALVNAAQRAALAEALAGSAHAGLPVLSASAPFRTGGRAGPDHFTDIPAGPLRLRNLVDLYGFPNTLCGLVVTGAELRDWLERAAICFNRIAPGAADQPLLDPSVPGHVFDVIDGLRYTIDPSQPARFDLSGALVAPDAHRIRDLTCEGRPVRDEDRFAIATNSYRAWGGGPFEALAERALIYRSDRAIRDVLADHVAARGPFTPAAHGTWRVATMPDGTSAVLRTGPGLRAHPGDIAAIGGTDTGLDEAGFLHLRLARSHRPPCKSRCSPLCLILERLARASSSPTRSGPEGSSRNEPRLGRCQPLVPPPSSLGSAGKSAVDPPRPSAYPARCEPGRSPACPRPPSPVIRSSRGNTAPRPLPTSSGRTRWCAR